MADINNPIPSPLAFSDVTVLVIGDLMLDRYWRGNSTRLSPEAPVPVVLLNDVKDVPGGAANVAANIVALGSKVLLAGVIGNDSASRSLIAAAEKVGVGADLLLQSSERTTTCKTRVQAHNHQVVRIDEEDLRPLTADEELKLISLIEPHIHQADVMVFSDYAKGCLTDSLLERLLSLANESGKPTLVDPKGVDFRKYKGATVITPNAIEAFTAAQVPHQNPESVSEAAALLLNQTEANFLLITLGENGMTLFEKEAEPIQYKSLARKVYDVTGAGDTVIATLAVALGSGVKIREAVSIANVAAGVVVERPGTATVSQEDLSVALGSEMPSRPLHSETLSSKMNV